MTASFLGLRKDDSIKWAIVVLSFALVLQWVRPYWLERCQRIEPGTTGLWDLEHDSQRYPGVIYLPTQYDQESDQTWPCLLYLHGSGDGDGDPWRLNDWSGPMSAAKKFDLPMVIYSPQCTATDGWDSALLLRTIDALEQEYRIDSQRIYVGGYSMGGFGTWELAAHAADRIAAIVPVAGGGHPRYAANLIDMPIWAFHGKQDSVVDVKQSEEMVDAVRLAGGNPRLTIFQYHGHWIWSSVFRDPEVYRWMLEQNRE